METENANKKTITIETDDGGFFTKITDLELKAELNCKGCKCENGFFEEQCVCCLRATLGDFYEQAEV